MHDELVCCKLYIAISIFIVFVNLCMRLYVIYDSLQEKPKLSLTQLIFVGLRKSRQKLRNFRQPG
jgi:hypothetical protein